MRNEESVRFGKKELSQRILLTNYFRIMMGGFFFVVLNVLYLFRVFLSPGGEALVFIGIYLLLYGLLTFYYLKTNGGVTLFELVFLASFLAVLDLVFTTSMIYFSGGVESPLFAVYIFNILAVAVMFPYYTKAVFWAAAANSVAYVGLIMILIRNIIPYYPRFPTAYAQRPDLFSIALINLFGVPGILFFFASSSYYLSKHLLEQRLRTEKIEKRNESDEKQTRGMYRISWLLCRLMNPEEMLNGVLHEILEMTNIKSGAIYVAADHKQFYKKAAGRDEPTLLDNYMSKITFGKMPSSEDAEFKQVLANEGFSKAFTVPLIAPPGRFMGMILLFAKHRDNVLLESIELLDSVGREIAIALGYSEMLTLKKKKPSSGKAPKRA